MGMFQTRGSNERYGVIESAIQRTVAATGSGQSDAALIGANVSNVTSASGTNGVVLRKGKGGNPYAGVVYSSAATNALLLYPPVGGAINGGTVNAALSIVARKPAIFWMIADGTGLNFIVNASA